MKEFGADRVLYGSFTINEPSAVIARVKNAFLTGENREKIRVTWNACSPARASSKRSSGARPVHPLARGDGFELLHVRARLRQNMMQ